MRFLARLDEPARDLVIAASLGRFSTCSLVALRFMRDESEWVLWSTRRLVLVLLTVVVVSVVLVAGAGGGGVAGRVGGGVGVSHVVSAAATTASAVMVVSTLVVRVRVVWLVVVVTRGSINEPVSASVHSIV